MERLFLVLFLVGWAVMVYKTIQVSAAQSDGFLSYYFVEMITNSWQSHFNIDLLMHSLLYSFWIVYREKHMLVALLCSLSSIAIGALISFLYLLIIALLCKGNLPLVINGQHTK